MAGRKNQRNGLHDELAAFVVLVAFAATTDAFKSIPLRSMQSRAWKSTGVAKHSGRLDLTHREKSQSFINQLRAAWTSEEYTVAQA
jgi:hypothetical protein